VHASIEIRAPIDEALYGWSEFCALTQGSFALAGRRTSPCWRAHFERCAGSRSRITLQLEHRGPSGEPAALRRALEDRLVAFKGFVDERGLRRCESAQG
jgi:hypothetical protein